MPEGTGAGAILLARQNALAVMGDPVTVLQSPDLDDFVSHAACQSFAVAGNSQRHDGAMRRDDADLLTALDIPESNCSI